MNIPKYVDLYRKDLEFKKYAPNTIEKYTFQVEYFLKSREKLFSEPSKINEQSIKEWLIQFKTRNAMCHTISALKLFYKMTVKQPLKFKYIEYPKSEKKLPEVIDSDFLLEKISEIKNLKHKAIITLAFSVGLRVSEICNLLIEDIDSNRMVVNIKSSKNNKDRVVPLTENALICLRQYFRVYNPKVYLFNGLSKKSLKYSHTSCNLIVKKYIGKKYHFHTLRHSCFTYLVEKGTNLRVIQELAGHSSSKTTELYTKVSKKSWDNVQLPC